ncbi:MAG TPA: DUF2071 domain-containing protein [Candidatus Limnocylindrales bacterium]
MDLTAAEAFARPRPRLAGFDASTTLEDLAIVTFDVDPERLATLLPASVTPEVRTLDSGTQRGFVSAVSFRDRDFRFAGASWLRVSFAQTNYRAYVRGPDGRRAVWFFGTTLDSPLVALPRHLWRMPWHGGATTLEAEWAADDVCRRYRHRCEGTWGGADVELVGTPERADRLDGFVDADDAAHVLTHPLDGWFRRTDGGLGRYSVWHGRMQPRLGIARRAHYAVFEDAGLVSAGAAPHSVLLQHEIDFDVILPPVQVD